jgi:glycine dehydrogenase
LRTKFSDRHIGPSDADIGAMLATLNLKSLEELTNTATPAAIRSNFVLDVGPGLSEDEFLKRARSVANKNKVFKSYIGQGYYDTSTPPVILRNILENPGWYTAYTPYQAEISQGRMEALLNFQTMISDLTGLPVANASLLDEGTAAAEAMLLSFHSQKKSPRTKILVDKDIFAQTLHVLETRAQALGLEIVVADTKTTSPNDEFFAVLAQHPTASGEVRDYTELATAAHAHNSHFILAADLLGLCILKSAKDYNADIAVGSAQRFGVPMGFGGPHAGYIAVREELTRLIPGRIIGVSKDAHGNHALRLALQTREQHIRREKATSNICTAQVLLAVMAAMYAAYHGPEGLKKIARDVHEKTLALAKMLTSMGYAVLHKKFFDTITLTFASSNEAAKCVEHFANQKINLARMSDTKVALSLNETTTVDDLSELIDLFASLKGEKQTVAAKHAPASSGSNLTDRELRTSEILTHPSFNSYQSETEMLRYLHRLEQKDLALNQAMIPLGSCTMKLNSTAEMMPVTWAEFGRLHPHAPAEQTLGYMELIHQLENWLCQLTGFAAVSLQPNAGSQGEYAGLLVIREFQKARGQGTRNICLIPTSAHGTNPASAVMAGMKVIPVNCDNAGNVEVSDLRAKAALHAKELSALMITYPSTHGVFEDSIREICEIVHEHGGQVYLDGANFNALVGIARPGDFGADVCHLNLHKTFCIPHGGGGPGVGPIGVAAHLKPFVGVTVSSAKWGSASILPISWAYIAMMGATGLKKATQVAILNANYIARRLSSHFPILYKGAGGLVAHECILDVRGCKTSADITVDDIAKRLMDYGFHAPTMSWPVAGTLMIEPTESESKEELDRFCEAMIAIRAEIAEIEDGKADRVDNALKNAPHPVGHVVADKWEHKYSREKAAFPLPWVRARKFWPSVARVDNVFGDRNLVCSCPTDWMTDP